MYKYRRFRTTMGGKTGIKEEFLKKFIVRKPTGKLDRLHPDAKRVYNRMIQEPEPLKYKLREIPEKEANYYWEISNPLGGTEALPFQVMRTHTNNLPVYMEYKNGRSIQETHIRHIHGDVEEFKRELSKIVSNSVVTHKIGKVIVKGKHCEKVKLWLRRLGF
jgi:large subunit ribosomal protein L49